MKFYYLVWFVLLTTNSSQAQNADPTPLKIFCEISQRALVAFQQRNAAQLQTCADDYMDVSMAPYTDALNWQVMDSLPPIPVRGHLLYNGAFIDSLLVADLDLFKPRIGIPENMHRNEAPEIYFTHCMAPAGGKGHYRVHCDKGHQQLMVMSDTPGHLSVQVNDEDGNQILILTDSIESPFLFFDWDKIRLTWVDILVTNNSPSPIYYIIATN